MLNKSDIVTGRVLNNNVYLKIPENNLKYWSPDLNAQITKTDTETIVKGNADPNPKIRAILWYFMG